MVKLEHQRKSTRLNVFLFIVFCLLLFIFFGLYIFINPFASTEKEQYFSGKHPILFEGKYSGNSIIDNENVYVPSTFIQEYLDEAMIFDEKSNSFIITTKDKVIQMPAESSAYFINGKKVEEKFQTVIIKGEEKFIALEPLLNYYSIDYSILPETGAIWIGKDGEERIKGTVVAERKNDAKRRLRVDATLRSPYTAEVNDDEPIFIEGKKDDYYYVRKANGIAGYLHKDLVQKGETEKITVEKENKDEPKLKTFEEPIHLTWEAVYTKNPDTSKIPKMPGVNIVSPTWFHLENEEGKLKNLASSDYVNWAKKNGYDVWGLFSNNFDPDLTHEAFKHFETRQKIIRQLLHYSKKYKLDGINIDIENVYPEDGPFITQFVREATPYFHHAGLIVSMDITFIAGGNWSAFYEREKLASVVDYLVVMAYDEHWGSSSVAGSVASLPWVENNLINLLEVVPNDKLILGVPLYTRLWSENENGEVSSKALSMEEAKKWMKKKKVTSIYDETSGQNYVEYYDQDKKVTYKMWLEDETSLRKRSEIAKKYDLAGVASWSRYFADETAWTALDIHSETVTSAN